MSSAENYRNQPRRRFSREVKREAVEILLEQAATVAEVARTYDFHPNRLCRWRTEYFRGAYGELSAESSLAATLLPIEIVDSIDMATDLTQADAPHSREGGARRRIRRLKIVLAK